MIEAPFKILSIDGGGIKGLYSATILKKLQDEFCPGKHISEYFDLVCGTSTGGLIALALTKKIDLDTIIDFYEEQGKEIFPNKGFFSRLKQVIYNGKYSNKVLQKNLENIFGDSTLGQANNLLCIPSFNLITNKPKVWKYPHKEGHLNADRNVKMIDVALATSAAPTYFPIHEIQDFGKHIDGGVWANNPTLCGINETIKHFLNKRIIQDEKLKFTSIQVLSIGSIQVNKGEIFRLKNHRSYFKWGFGKKLIDIMMSASSFGANQISNNLLEGLGNNSMITRVETGDLSEYHKSNIDIDLVSGESLKLLKQLATDKANYLIARDRQSVELFFKSFKNYKTL